MLNSKTKGLYPSLRNLRVVIEEKKIKESDNVSINENSIDILEDDDAVIYVPISFNLSPSTDELYQKLKADQEVFEKRCSIFCSFKNNLTSQNVLRDLIKKEEIKLKALATQLASALTQEIQLFITKMTTTPKYYPSTDEIIIFNEINKVLNNVIPSILNQNVHEQFTKK